MSAGEKVDEKKVLTVNPDEPDGIEAAKTLRVLMQAAKEAKLKKSKPASK